MILFAVTVNVPTASAVNCAAVILFADIATVPIELAAISEEPIAPATMLTAPIEFAAISELPIAPATIAVAPIELADICTLPIEFPDICTLPIAFAATSSSLSIFILFVNEVNSKVPALLATCAKTASEEESILSACLYMFLPEYALEGTEVISILVALVM